MNMNAVVGGAACHWGGPSAFSEIMSSIHGIAFSAEDWRESFNIINDAGHCENGLYALKANYGYDGLSFEDLKKFRSLESHLTGHGEGHVWPAGVQVSNGPLGSSLPVAQGIAMADALAGNERVTVCAISDGAMMEGEAKEAVTAIPGFAAKVHFELQQLVRAFHVAGFQDLGNTQVNLEKVINPDFSFYGLFSQGTRCRHRVVLFFLGFFNHGVYLFIFYAHQ